MFRNLNRCLLMILVVGIAVAPVSTVFATPPEPFEAEAVVEGYVWVSCPGFDAIANFVYTVHGLTFFDNEGNPIREQGHLKFTGTLTNSATGKTVSDTPDAQNWDYDYATGLLTTRGLQWKIVVPGEGRVVIDAGTVTVDTVTGELVVVHGPHQIDQEGVMVLCSVLE